MDPELRRCLAEAIAEDDRLRAEDARAAARAALVRKSDGEPLMYRTHDGNVPVELAEAGPAPLEPGVWDEGTVQMVADVVDLVEQRAERKLAEVMESAKAEWQLRLERETSALRAELAEAHGFLRGILTVLSPRLEDTSKSGQVVDLVPWRRRDA